MICLGFGSTTFSSGYNFTLDLSHHFLGSSLGLGIEIWQDMLQVHVLVRKIHKDHQKMCKNLTGCSKSSPEDLRDDLKTMTSEKTNFILMPRVLKLNIHQARICMQFGCSHTCVHVACVGCCYMLRHLLIRKTDKVSLIWPHKTVWPKNDISSKCRHDWMSRGSGVKDCP